MLSGTPCCPGCLGFFPSGAAHGSRLLPSAERRAVSARGRGFSRRADDIGPARSPTGRVRVSVSVGVAGNGGSSGRAATARRGGTAAAPPPQRAPTNRFAARSPAATAAAWSSMGDTRVFLKTM
ncbi:hypothetical protein GCM10010423_02200 [Streptomyces levis]|uniref:Uncharacterized protein n=1 Tax=Streptomyces levis TaxID=285566 RepID=A0ABN3N5W2_9ACTN